MSSIPVPLPATAVTKTSVLIVEDDAMFARLLRVQLEVDGKGRFDAVQAASLAEAESVLLSTTQGVSVVLLDLTLPDGHGLAAVRRVQAFAGSAAIVVITGHDDDNTALAVVGAGAQDYLVKGGLNGATVIRAINYAIVRRRLELERDLLIIDLQAALARVKTLEGILPICAKCKRIRNDDGQWERVEEYVTERTRAQFSHGICEPCSHELYGELADGVHHGD